METKKVFKRLAAIGAGICLLGATLLTAGCGVDEEVHKKALDDLKEVQDKATALEEAKAALEEAKTLSDEQVAGLEQEKEALTADLESYKLELSEIEATQAEEDLSYAIDELGLGAAFSKVLTDKEVDLVDGEVEFDDEDYEVEEYLLVSGNVALNEEDFGAEAFLQFAEEDIQYFVQFDEALDVSEISSDEPLKFSFLGEELKIVDWDEGEVELAMGVEYSMAEGEKIPLAGGVELELFAVTEDLVVVKIGDVQEQIYLDDVEEVNGYEVRVTEITYQAYAGGIHAAEIDVGEEVKVVLEDGDEYNDDEKWETFIGDHILGIKLVEEFKEVDEDEEYQALAYGDTLSLPNDFAVLSFEPLSEEDYYKYSFELENKGGDDYVEVKGDFVNDLEDYDRLYVKADGIYDEDLELLDAASIEMDDADFNLEIDGDELVVGAFKLKLDLTAIELDGVDVSGVDEDMRSEYGFVLNNPEDSLEEEKVKLEIPEELIEATVKVKR